MGHINALLLASKFSPPVDDGRGHTQTALTSPPVIHTLAETALKYSCEPYLPIPKGFSVCNVNVCAHACARTRACVNITRWVAIVDRFVVQLHPSEALYQPTCQAFIMVIMYHCVRGHNDNDVLLHDRAISRHDPTHAAPPIRALRALNAHAIAIVRKLLCFSMGGAAAAIARPTAVGSSLIIGLTVADLVVVVRPTSAREFGREKFW